MSLVANKAAVSRLYADVFTRGNLATIGDLIAADYVGYDPPDSSRAMYGHTAMRQAAERMALAFPDRHYRVDMLIAEEDMVAARVTFSGTHTGQFFDLSPTGHKISFTGTVTYRFIGGRIVASWGSWDNLGLMRQLGLLNS